MEQRFKLHYWISNNGDGSASLRLAESAEEAEQQDEGQDEGWGECCASSKDLIYSDGRLFFEHREWDNVNNKVIVTRKEIEQI